MYCVTHFCATMEDLQRYIDYGLKRTRSDPHIGPDDVEAVLSGLADNMVVSLPSTCCQAVGLIPNIGDKSAPKELVSQNADWIHVVGLSKPK